jgi:hypothetical protein
LAYTTFFFLAMAALLGLWSHKYWLGLSKSRSNFNFFQNWLFDLSVLDPWRHFIGQTPQEDLRRKLSWGLAIYKGLTWPILKCNNPQDFHPQHCRLQPFPEFFSLPKI